jgi:hypothetical protein
MVTMPPPRSGQDDEAAGWRFAELDETTREEAKQEAAQSWATHEALQRGRFRAVERIEARAKRIARVTSAGFLVAVVLSFLALSGTNFLLPFGIAILTLAMIVFFALGLSSGRPVSPLASGLDRHEMLAPDMKIHGLDVVTPFGVILHRTSLMVGLVAVCLFIPLWMAVALLLGPSVMS